MLTYNFKWETAFFFSKNKKCLRVNGSKGFYWGSEDILKDSKIGLL